MGENGGSLFLITEHYPFGLAMLPLLHRFNADVHNGYTEDSTLSNKEVRDALLFTTVANINRFKERKQITTFGSSDKSISSLLQI